MVGETDPGLPKPPLSGAVSGSPRGLPPPQLQLRGLRQQQGKGGMLGGPAQGGTPACSVEEGRE